MLNEGIITNGSEALLKSEMVRQLKKLGETTPEEWERATFKAFTGGTRDELDWEVEDNKAGYFLWIKTFDAFIDELVSEGYAVVETAESGERKSIRPGEAEGTGDWSQLVYPPQSE
jgi:hypothetical protein